jgi:hypothetical protein
VDGHSGEWETLGRHNLHQPVRLGGTCTHAHSDTQWCEA